MAQNNGTGNNNITVDKAMQGQEVERDVLLKITEPPRRERVRRGIEHMVGVIFPWVTPCDDSD